MVGHSISASAAGKKSILGVSVLPVLNSASIRAGHQYGAPRDIDLAYQVGARGIHLADRWCDLAPSLGQYNLNGLSYSIDYLSSHGFLIQMVLEVVNATTKQTPHDLLIIPFNAKKMLDRFQALFNTLLPHLTRSVIYLSIGNEVDQYLAIHNDWISYKIFYDEIVAHVHKTAPWLKVGVTCTFSGAAGKSADEIAQLNTSSDAYMLTYYPLTSGFLAQDPSAPLTDIPRMIALAAGRPLILQEVGYPTSLVLNGSEEKQAEFVSNIYLAWKAAGQYISFLNFFLMHDFTLSFYEKFRSDHGLPVDEGFRQFLCSIGLRNANGRPKLGWNAFVDGAKTLK